MRYLNWNISVLWEYPGYPTEIVFSRKKLSWLAPMRWKSVFSVQYLINKQKNNWMEVGRTLEKTIHSKSLSKFLPHGVHFCCVRICINVTTTLQNKICSPGKMVEDSPGLCTSNDDENTFDIWGVCEKLSSRCKLSILGLDFVYWSALESSHISPLAFLISLSKQMQ